MARRNEVRGTIRLRSTAGTGYTYMTTKNRRNTPDRLTVRKFDPRIRQVVEFREER
ncbi:50S ribosomal protein L33 [Brachybacterium sp. DNPG3]